MKYLMIAIFILPTVLYAWDGTDADSGADIEIDKGNLVRRGKTIEFYDGESGEYRTGEVESIRSRGSKVEVEVYDNETGEYRTFDMRKK